MSASPRPLLVLRREIERDPRPAGGNFSALSLTPIPLPRTITSVLSVFCTNTTEPLVAITWDDGPHPQHTPRILDVLHERGATATFFVLASQAERYPHIVERVIADGHEIALHGFDHRSLLTMSTLSALASVRRARSVVEQIAGRAITLYRPPYGEFTLAQALGIRALGLEIVTWSADALDWLDDDEGAIAARAISTVFSGGILLLHDDRADPETIAPGELLPAFDRALVARLVLEGLESRGYETVTASDLLDSHQHVRSLAKHRVAKS